MKICAVIILCFSCTFLQAYSTKNALDYFPMDIKDYPLIFIDTIEKVHRGNTHLIDDSSDENFWPISDRDKEIIEKFNRKQRIKRGVENLFVQPSQLSHYEINPYPYVIKAIHEFDPTELHQVTKINFQVMDRRTNQIYPAYKSYVHNPGVLYLNELHKFIRLTERKTDESVIEKIENKEKERKVLGYALFGLGIAAGPIIAVLLDL